MENGRFAVFAEESSVKRMRVRESQATTVAAPGLEMAVAVQYDPTWGDSDVGRPEQSESDTGSVGHKADARLPKKVELTVIVTSGPLQICFSGWAG